MGQPNLNNFEEHLEFSKCQSIKLLRARIRKFYELCFLGLIDIEQPSYEDYGGKLREKSGIDTQISLKDKDILIQEKIRTPKYWRNRQKDLFVELTNEYRGGNGWFEKYKDKIDYIGYYWIKDNELSEIHFVLYNSEFFNEIKKAIEYNLIFYPQPHFQQDKNGNVGGKTSGCIIDQKYLIGCEVARFKFNNNNFERANLNN